MEAWRAIAHQGMSDGQVPEAETQAAVVGDWTELSGCRGGGGGEGGGGGRQQEGLTCETCVGTGRDGIPVAFLGLMGRKGRSCASRGEPREPSGSELVTLKPTTEFPGPSKERKL